MSAEKQESAPAQDQQEPTPAKDEQDESSEELESSEPGEVGDDKLPDDLQPTEDNPLARHPGQTGEDDDLIGAAGDEERARNPSASMGYGSAGSEEGDEEESAEE